MRLLAVLLQALGPLHSGIIQSLRNLDAFVKAFID